MNITHRLTFRADEHPELVAHLNRTFAKWNRGRVFSTLDISESDFRWAFLGPCCAEHGLSAQPQTTVVKEELFSAPWLQVRSNWHWSYPQPGDWYQTATYAPAPCPSCGAGREKIAPFRMKTSPKWDKRHFLSLNWVHGELFTDDTAAALGIPIREVLPKTGETPLPGVHQIRIPSILPSGLLPDARTSGKYGPTPIAA